MHQHFYTTGELAKRLDIAPYKIHYLLSCHKISEPNLRIGSRRVWTEAEITPIAERLKTKKGGDHE